MWRLVGAGLHLSDPHMILSEDHMACRVIFVAQHFFFFLGGVYTFHYIWQNWYQRKIQDWISLHAWQLRDRHLTRWNEPPQCFNSAGETTTTKTSKQKTDGAGFLRKSELMYGRVWRRNWVRFITTTEMLSPMYRLEFLCWNQACEQFHGLVWVLFLAVSLLNQISWPSWNFWGLIYIVS